MFSLDIPNVVLVPGVQVGLTKQKMVAQYDPAKQEKYFSATDGIQAYQVILSDLIPSRHPNLADPPFAGASKMNLMFSLREKAFII